MIAWSYRYSVLVERYANIIKGQFFGHMHMDYFFITRSQADNAPVAVTQQLPPLTTYHDFFCDPAHGAKIQNCRRPNPSYRIYAVDRESYDLLNYEQYRLFLAEANELLKDDWVVGYRFLEYYDLPNMRPESYAHLIHLMEVCLKQHVSESQQNQ